MYLWNLCVLPSVIFSWKKIYNLSTIVTCYISSNACWSRLTQFLPCLSVNDLFYLCILEKYMLLSFLEGRQESSMDQFSFPLDISIIKFLNRSDLSLLDYIYTLVASGRKYLWLDLLAVSYIYKYYNFLNWASIQIQIFKKIQVLSNRNTHWLSQRYLQVLFFLLSDFSLLWIVKDQYKYYAYLPVSLAHLELWLIYLVNQVCNWSVGSLLVLYVQ